MRAVGWIAFHTGASIVPAADATFALAMSLPDLAALSNGTDEMPETSATVILQVASLTIGTRFVLEGPGLREPTIIAIDGLPADFVAIWQRNHGLLPARHRPDPVRRQATDRAAAQRHRPGGLSMAYVAVKGGEQAIDNAHAWLAEERRGDTATPALSVAQIEEQLGRAVDRVMAEGSLYDRELAALAIKQAQGDLIEAAFLLRAYRTTLPRFAHSRPVETATMRIERRVSAMFKDLPGGQVLGPTYDYTHRLLDFSLLEDAADCSGVDRGSLRLWKRCRVCRISWAMKGCWNPTSHRIASRAT